MQWYRADVGRHRHRKVRRLARLLRVPTMHAVGIHDTVCALLAETDSVDGVFGSITPADVADACEHPDAEELLDALAAADIIDHGTDGSITLHGFADRNGAHIRKSLADAERQRILRVNRATIAGPSRDHRASVERESREHRGHTNERTNEQIPPKPPVAVEADLEPLLRESIEQEKAKKAEQLTLANPEPAGRPLAAFVEAWNRGCLGSSIPKAIEPGTRASARDKRLREETLRFPEPEAWFWCAKALGASPGHNGRGTSGFVADLPWLLERGKGAKLEQWMARGAELKARGGKVAPAPMAGERGDERTVRAANAYREEQQKKHEEVMARAAPTDPEATKKGLALVRGMLPQFKRQEGPT